MTMDFLQIVWEPASDGIRLFGNFKIHYYSMMWIVAFVLGYRHHEKNLLPMKNNLRKNLIACLCTPY